MSTRTTTMRTRQSSRMAGSQSQDAQSAAAAAAAASDEKENVKMNGSGKARVTRKGSKAYCVCRKPDDGSPMIHCSTCKDWFHFRCVGLTELEAGEIQSYACPSCHQKAGARTVNLSFAFDPLPPFRLM
ncbi:hypothetical protein C8Q76DRAFT_691152 [Earliella scabrosa]|nr:hypothetical protein C8Q76DRAFT_691152 [Earliella scabrosa]